jgi:hypothetical protein
LYKDFLAFEVIIKQPQNPPGLFWKQQEFLNIDAAVFLIWWHMWHNRKYKLDLCSGFWHIPPKMQRFWGGAVLEFELRVLHLLNIHHATWSMPPTLFAQIFQIQPYMFCLALPLTGYPPHYASQGTWITEIQIFKCLLYMINILDMCYILSNT